MPFFVYIGRPEILRFSGRISFKVGRFDRHRTKGDIMARYEEIRKGATGNVQKETEDMMKKYEVYREEADQEGQKGKIEDRIPEIQALVNWYESGPCVHWPALKEYWEDCEAKMKGLSESADFAERFTGLFVNDALADTVSEYTGVWLGDSIIGTRFNRRAVEIWMMDHDAYMREHGYICFDDFVNFYSLMLHPLWYLRGELKFGDIVYLREEDEFTPVRLLNIIYERGEFIAELEDREYDSLNFLYARPCIVRPEEEAQALRAAAFKGVRRV